MEVLEAIRNRRSVRGFKDEQVPRKMIREILDAGRLAPSGSNSQPLEVFIISSKKAKDDLQSKGAFVQEFVHKAPTLLAICGDPKAYETDDPSLSGKDKERCLRDLSIASAFMVLRATDLGLGSIWVALIDAAVIKKEVGIPESYILPYCLCVGYPDEAPRELDRKTPGETLLGEI